MERLVDKLRRSQHRWSTKRNYYFIWTKFNEFFIKLDRKPQSWEERLVLFVSYLIDKNRKSSTIKSYISAIKAILQEDDIVLNEDRYLLTSLTRACRLKNDRVRTHLPLQKGMLNLILEKTEEYFLKTVFFH